MEQLRKDAFPGSSGMMPFGWTRDVENFLMISADVIELNMQNGELSPMNCNRELCENILYSLFLAMFFVSVFTFGFSGKAWAAVPLGYPGSTYWEFRSPSSVEVNEDNNYVLEGVIEQGIDWFRVTEWSIFNTFARFGYARDKENFDFNNKLLLEGGAKLKFPLRDHTYLDWGNLDIGVKYSYEHRPESDRDETQVVFFATWGAGWDLKKVFSSVNKK